MVVEGHRIFGPGRRRWGRQSSSESRNFGGLGWRLGMFLTREDQMTPCVRWDEEPSVAEGARLLEMDGRASESLVSGFD